MKSKDLIFRVLILFAMHAIVLVKAAELSGDLHEVLKHAGGNRIELQTALREAKGGDTEYLITHASQYDLVNLTADMIFRNVGNAREVDGELLHTGKKPHGELWREWVLPSRVLDEDLNPAWREELHDILQPVITGKTTTREVVAAICAWMRMKLEDGEERVGFAAVATAESRPRSPMQILEARGGFCLQLNLFLVACLRSLGIPARHCVMSWWYKEDQQHFFTQYWSSEEQRWLVEDAPYHLDPTRKLEEGTWNCLAMYAYPAYPGEPDLYGRNRWDQCINITSDLIEVYPVYLKVPKGTRKFAVAAYVWNTGSWRMFLTEMLEVAEGSDSGVIELAKTAELDLPVLYTAKVGDRWYGAMKKPSSADAVVELQPMRDGAMPEWKAP